jgi:hypothetical protein
MSADNLDKQGREKDMEVTDAVVVHESEMTSIQKAQMVRKRNAEMRRAIKKMLTSNEIANFQKALLENWAEFLLSEDLAVRAMATKEASKYVFAQKREKEQLPDVTIETNFRGIKDNKAIIQLQEEVDELKRKLKRYETNVEKNS